MWQNLRAAFLISAVGMLSAFNAFAEDVTVAVTQIVEHPALDSVREGVRDELASHGYVAGENMTWYYESAQGNSGTAAQIARKFIGDKPDVIVAIATPSAQTVAAVARSVPVVFSAVTDPVSAKLVSSSELPGANITGVSDQLPMARHMDMILEAVPGAKTIGTVYSPGEANAVALVEALEAELSARGIKLEKAAATKSSEVLAAARSLAGKVDAIFLTTDNTVITAAEAVIQLGYRAKIPVFAADTDTVARGAAAALGFNYYDVGRQTGAMVVRILEGAEPATMPVEVPEKLSLHVNPASAERMGLTLPQPLIDRADKVIQ
ncbi:ABC transporter substrate-binding protein [Hydrocarboniclastica marina]|mgnify:CR=1 FL=1|uniref:ABC transporter permease n=1 Tax=Hydrocarboniclastica marina TaxID=2259620 RepID=A0A4P7XFU6_9ALTE|nr:ABC transporter substrate-binding protein [Hydrocarboniclastica marina]MAL98398.1 ABC transporter permease [Alteromonadaceae bacterium]QCF25841.1 ABC transporter permease [Hydrocarboniclastica marina]|tara:strand:- start:2866 stop:3831 length:966 start_codon:yes stop_codon:yes gene_type:complete